MKDDKIEREVERQTDRVDADYMAGRLTTEQYEKRMAAIDRWADDAYTGRYRGRTRAPDYDPLDHDQSMNG